MNRPLRTERRSERGSALLIVFVFAAILAIMLYEEMPVAAFEAQRQKEQLLIDRGNEYAHAVKLFVRKVGTYPSSMDALESTNQMRFLRHRFKDPLTGKDDWRVLHAGPNGMLTDSKVKPAGNAQNGSSGQNSSTTGGSAFGSSSSSSTFGSNSSNSTQGNSGFGSSGFFGSDSSSTSAAVVVPPIRQRSPAISANGSAAASSGSTDSSADQNPMDPLLPPGQAAAQTALQSGTSPSGTTAGAPGQANTGQAGTNGSSSNGNAAGGAGTWTAGKYSLGQQPTTVGSSTGMGTINSGGIAGVASIAKGHSIKVVNDQTDYSLWEFYYDPTKDATKGIANAVAGMAAGQQTNSQQSPFGQNQQQSGFGSSNIFGNSSGTNNSSGSSTTTTTATPSSGTSTQSTQPPQ